VHLFVSSVAIVIGAANFLVAKNDHQCGTPSINIGIGYWSQTRVGTILDGSYPGLTLATPEYFSRHDWSGCLGERSCLESVLMG